MIVHTPLDTRGRRRLILDVLVLSKVCSMEQVSPGFEESERYKYISYRVNELLLPRTRLAQSSILKAQLEAAPLEGLSNTATESLFVSLHKHSLSSEVTLDELVSFLYVWLTGINQLDFDEFPDFITNTLRTLNTHSHFHPVKADSYVHINHLCNIKQAIKDVCYYLNIRRKSLDRNEWCLLTNKCIAGLVLTHGMIYINRGSEISGLQELTSCSSLLALLDNLANM